MWATRQDQFSLIQSSWASFAFCSPGSCDPPMATHTCDAPNGKHLQYLFFSQLKRLREKCVKSDNKCCHKSAKITLSQKCKNHKNSNKMVTIQLLEYPIPPPPPPALHHKKSEWRYLGNEKSYQRSAGVYYDWKNSKYKKISKKNVKKIWLFLDFSVISRTHYPIIAPLRGSRSLSARRAWRTLSSRPGGAPRRALRPWDPRNATMISGMTWKSDCKQIHTFPQINRC